MPHFHHLVLSFVATVLLVPAAAQTVYRCGNHYSQKPCPGGKAIDVDDSRTPQQKAQTDAAAAQATRAAAQMERERLAREKEAGAEKATRPKTATGAATGPAPAINKSGKQKKTEPDLFVASSGVAAKKSGNTKAGKK